MQTLHQRQVGTRKNDGGDDFPHEETLKTQQGGPRGVRRGIPRRRPNDRFEAELSAAAALVCQSVGSEALTRLGNRKFADSPLEETVRSELVSLSEFPVKQGINREFAPIWGSRGHLEIAKKGAASVPYETIPDASEQGIYFGPTGNWIGASGNFSADQGIGILIIRRVSTAKASGAG